MALIPRGGDDNIYTPDYLASEIVGHFKPQISGKVLEPCRGGGAFLRGFKTHKISPVVSTEISEGSDFFQFDSRVNWIITNPPWSKIRWFLVHSYELSNNIVFLMSINAILGLKARIRDMQEHGFAIKEIYMIKTPKVWPSTGMQAAAIHFKKGWKEGMILSKALED